jgi:hypothetical protein
MRVVRTILGILLLTVGLPLLLVGGALWMAMQHRDAGGAFSGDIEDIRTQGYAVVVPDVDTLLRRQAPFARGEQTRLRLTAHTDAAPAFIGMAPPAEAARFLAGVSHTRIEEVRLARGDLPVHAVPVAGDAEPASAPRGQRFWVRSGTGSLEWSPAATRGERLALVVMSADGQPPRIVTATAEVRAGWLDSSTWGLLVLGSVLLLLGIVFLAWPTRSREVVYVVDPSQVPEIAARLGVPLPSPGAGAGGRPATLAESGGSGWPGAASPVAPPVAPRLAWPPVQPTGGTPVAAGTPSGEPVPVPAGGAVAAPAAAHAAQAAEAAPDASAKPPPDAADAADAAEPGEPAAEPESAAQPGEPDAEAESAAAPGEPAAEPGTPAAEAAGGADAAGGMGAAAKTEPPREPVARPLSSLGVPPAVVSPRSARRRRAEQGIMPEEPIAPTGASVAAAVAARRPGRPRNPGKAKPPKSEDHPVA